MCSTQFEEIESKNEAWDNSTPPENGQELTAEARIEISRDFMRIAVIQYMYCRIKTSGNDLRRECQVNEKQFIHRWSLFRVSKKQLTCSARRIGS